MNSIYNTIFTTQNKNHITFALRHEATLVCHDHLMAAAAAATTAGKHVHQAPVISS